MTIEEQIAEAQRKVEKMKKIQAAFDKIIALAAEKLECLNVDLGLKDEGGCIVVDISSKVKEGLNPSRRMATFVLEVDAEGDKIAVKTFSPHIGVVSAFRICPRRFALWRK